MLLTLLTGLLFLATTAAATAITGPVLQVEAPDALTAYAARVRGVPPEAFHDAIHLTGLRDSAELSRPIRVVLAEEGSPLAKRAPEWVSGYAYGELGVVVLLPARVTTYPDDSFEELLVHEVTHVLIARAAGGEPVPRWLHEGVAMLAAGEWGLQDRSRLTVALLRARPSSLLGLEADFGRGATSSQRAYGIAGAFVRYVEEDHGKGWIPLLLRKLGEGERFPKAFREATGTPFYRMEEAFWHRETLWVRWVPVVTSSTLLWILISLLAVWAMLRHRRRYLERMERWEEEEAEEEQRREEAAWVHPSRTRDGEWIH